MHIQAMSAPEQYAKAIAARRRFALPGYTTLTDAGFDGEYVSPVQIQSGDLYGPILIAKDWLDFPSVYANRTVLSELGYLPGIRFNTVIDMSLARVGLQRRQIYLTQTFHLLPAVRSSYIPVRDCRASFDAVTRLELMGRKPIALGQDAEKALSHFGIPYESADHPSARKAYKEKAESIANAILKVLT